MECFKEVYFYKYCYKCIHEKNKDYETPCDDCLAEPVNEYSHKPLYFKEKSDEK